MKLVWRILISAIVFITGGLLLFRDNDEQKPSRSPALPGEERNSAGSTLVPDFYTSDLVAPTISKAVRDLPGYKPEYKLNREINDRQFLDIDLDFLNDYPGSVDSLLARQEFLPRASQDAAFLTPILNFTGQLDTSVDPPDTEGDVGPDHYIQAVNGSNGGQFTIYSKDDGSVVSGPHAMNQLADASSDCSYGFGDVIVLYDGMADRWLLSEFADLGYHLCVYISQTGDPTGSWYNYDFETPNFPDYPKYAVWPDAFYVTTNETTGPAIYALDREKMLAGQPTTFQRFSTSKLAGFGFNALTPADLDGVLVPPDGSPGYLMRHYDDEFHSPDSNNPSRDFLQIWEFTVDFDTPANSHFTGPVNIPISEIDSSFCKFNPYNCFPQPGTSTKLDAVKEVIMWRLQYRNFGNYETLVGNFVHDVDGTDHGGIRWFELRKSGTGSWEIYQEGTYAPDSHHRWMGSIAMDRDGNIALGYSVVSSSLFPSIRYAGRMSGDPLGVLSHGESSIFSGTGYQNTSRWGDYSAMRVDPVDDCTFWYTNMAANAAHNWVTQVAAFKFSSCGVGERIWLPLVSKLDGNMLW